MNEQVMVVKLCTGEEFIGKTAFDTEGNVTLTDIVQMVPVSETQFAFMQYLKYCDMKNGITIPARFIMFSVKIDVALEKEYKNSFSKLVVPSKPSLKLVTP